MHLNSLGLPHIYLLLIKASLSIEVPFFQNLYILLYKAIRCLCLLRKIFITTEPIEFSILEKLYIGPWMVLGFFIF